MKRNHLRIEDMALRACKSANAQCICVRRGDPPGQKLRRRRCGDLYDAAVRTIIDRAVWGITREKT